MENQIQQNEKVSNRAWVKYKKTITIAAVIVVVFLMFIGWGIFKQWQMRRGVERFAQALKQLEQEDYRRAMADTYGGKTPQETLQMYIDAVEKGDFELASKYFIDSKQKDELERMNNTNNNPDDLKAFLSFIKKSEPWRSSLDDDNFTMEAKTNLGPSVFIRFVKYPNSVWKISEI